MYAYILNGIVAFLATEDDYNKADRDYQAHCVPTNDDTNAVVGAIYDRVLCTFTVPEPVPYEPTPVDLDALKVDKITESKLALAAWLESHPMQFTDGKYYSVTEEKQSLLNNNLTSYERAVEAGIPYPLKWNATGEECVEWEYADLVVLSLAIAAYVAPKVAMQQAVEIEINACETAEQLEAVIISYD